MDAFKQFLIRLTVLGLVFSLLELIIQREGSGGGVFQSASKVLGITLLAAALSLL